MTRRIAWIIGIAALSGCGPSPHSPTSGSIGTLAVRPVEWNAATTPIGTVRAVADAGDVVAVFADDGATVFSGTGAFVAHDGHVQGWVAAGSILATGSASRWVVGIDSAGRIYRLRALNAFEDVSARYQLAGKRVRAVTMLGPGREAFLLDGEIAFSDARQVSVYGSSAFSSFAGGGGFGAGVVDDGVELVNSANGIVTRFPLRGARWATVDAKGRLYAATARGVYAADASGALRLVYDAGHDGIHGLVAAGAGERVWFADRTELGTIEGERVAVTKGAEVAPTAKLEPSPSGDVWVFDARNLARFHAEAGPEASPTHASRWSTMVGPVFARACAQCHQPGGVSGIDLSTEAAWTAKRDVIRQRAIVSRTMPPQGHTLSNNDRDVLEGWLR